MVCEGVGGLAVERHVQSLRGRRSARQDRGRVRRSCTASALETREGGLAGGGDRYQRAALGEGDVGWHGRRMGGNRSDARCVSALMGGWAEVGGERGEMADRRNGGGGAQGSLPLRRGQQVRRVLSWGMGGGARSFKRKGGSIRSLHQDAIQALWTGLGRSIGRRLRCRGRQTHEGGGRRPFLCGGRGPAPSQQARAWRLLGSRRGAGRA